jgi:hypothetical protein
METGRKRRKPEPSPPRVAEGLAQRLAKLERSHVELKADFMKSRVFRVKVISSQILLQFLGEQPKKARPCNCFYALKNSKKMSSMVRHAFPEHTRSDYETGRLLRCFDSLIEGRNIHVHPALDATLDEEIEYLIELLEREDIAGRSLSLGGFTALQVLKARRNIVRCTPFLHGSNHTNRVREMHAEGH